MLPSLAWLLRHQFLERGWKGEREREEAVRLQLWGKVAQFRLQTRVAARWAGRGRGSSAWKPQGAGQELRAQGSLPHQRVDLRRGAPK